MSTHDTQISEDAEKQDNAPYTVGVRLQRLRQKKDLSIKQVAAETHISSSNLIAIENEHFDQLPADIFIRGLVRIYGTFLGIDGAEAAKLFIKERDQQQPRRKKSLISRSSSSLTPKKLAEPSHISSATIAALLLVLIVASFTSFCVYTGWNPFAYFLQQTQPAIAPLSETIDQEPVRTTPEAQPAVPAAKPTEQAAAPENASAEATLPYTLTAVFTHDTGVDIIIDGQEPVHVQGVEGKQMQWQAGETIRLLFDEPASAQLTVNHTSVAFPTKKHDGKLTLTIPDELPRP